MAQDVNPGIASCFPEKKFTNSSDRQAVSSKPMAEVNVGEYASNFGFGRRLLKVLRIQKLKSIQLKKCVDIRWEYTDEMTRKHFSACFVGSMF